MKLSSCYMNRLEYSTRDYHNMTGKLLKVWMFLASNILDHISSKSVRANLPNIRSWQLSVEGISFVTLCNMCKQVLVFGAESVMDKLLMVVPLKYFGSGKFRYFWQEYCIHVLKTFVDITCMFIIVLISSWWIVSLLHSMGGLVVVGETGDVKWLQQVFGYLPWLLFYSFTDICAARWSSNLHSFNLVKLLEKGSPAVINLWNYISMYILKSVSIYWSFGCTKVSEICIACIPFAAASEWPGSNENLVFAKWPEVCLGYSINWE